MFTKRFTAKQCVVGLVNRVNVVACADEFGNLVVGQNLISLGFIFQNAGDNISTYMTCRPVITYATYTELLDVS